MAEVRTRAGKGVVLLVIASRLTVLPLIRSGSELLDLLARMAWAIGTASFRECVVFISDASLADVEWSVPELMDPAIAGNFPALRPRVRFVAAPSAEAVIEHLAGSDFVVLAEDPPQWDLLSEGEWIEALNRKKILRCDPIRSRQEFGNWVELNFQLRADRYAEIEQCRSRFARLVEECGGAGTACCLATGPSLAAFKETNFDGAISIICNSAILDEELMAWVRPRLLVFADPIFHFGPSKYAAEFRRKLRDSCARHDYTIIVPMRYYGLLTDAMPELRGRTIGIPSDKPNGFNLDLSNEFRVFTTANILTYLMLPLASTFARRICLLGCDGRPLDEDGYFWRHNQRTQINDQMENIRRVHPGFFAIDYNDYYLDHCRQLEELIGEGEKMGREYGTVTPSHIPALQSRPANLPRMLVIDFTEIGARNATGQLKSALFRNWPAESILQVRPLSTRDGSFFRLHSPAEHPAFKEAKLTREDVLRECGDFDPQVIYFRPTESPPEFVELGWELVQRLGVPVITHIMDDWPERLRLENPALHARVDPTLRELLRRSDARLSISDAMSAAYRERYGFDFTPVANGIDPADWPPVDRYRERGEPLVIRYCGGLTEDMSLAAVEMLARAVGELGAELPIRFEIYALPAALKIAQARFREFRGVEVLPSVEQADYPGLLSSAGAVLIAYNFDDRTRAYTQFSMANKLPECLASGAPLIVIGPDTIATVRRARELGAAVVVAQPDPDALDDALRRLAQEPAIFRERALAARKRALAELDVEGSRRIFQDSVFRLDRVRRDKSEGRTLLGPYTRLHRRRIDDCDVAARFFRDAASATVAVAVGDVARRRLDRFLSREWNVISCPAPAAAQRNVSTLAQRFGKNAVAVVLCNAADLCRVDPLPHPIRTAATLVFCEGDGDGSAALAGCMKIDPGIRAVWSERYAPLGSSPLPDYRLLREIADPAAIPRGRPGTLLLLDPSVIKVPRGAGDAVVHLRKAYVAALNVHPAEVANVGAGQGGVANRIQQWLRAWGTALMRLNVRHQVSGFFRDRVAEFREIFSPSRRGRLIVWK
ncbi:MAG: hypothetical protein PHC88_02995 [Terrimicrobiaceae bacterium]|nr:hypothetical protein [Terrimicrobiaceae bacterium]